MTQSQVIYLRHMNGGASVLIVLMCVCFMSCRQAAERMTLQKQLQRLMDPNKAEATPSRSPR